MENTHRDGHLGRSVGSDDSFLIGKVFDFASTPSRFVSPCSKGLANKKLVNSDLHVVRKQWTAFCFAGAASFSVMNSSVSVAWQGLSVQESISRGGGLKANKSASGINLQ